MVLRKHRGMRASGRKPKDLWKRELFKIKLNLFVCLFIYLGWDSENKKAWPIKDGGRTKKRAEHGDCLRSCCPIEIEHEPHVILDFLVATF